MIFKIENSENTVPERIIGLRRDGDRIVLCELDKNGNIKHNLLSLMPSGEIHLATGLTGTGYQTHGSGKLNVLNYHF